MTNKSQGAPQNPNPDYQDRDILIKPIVIFLVSLLVLTVLVVVAMGVYFRTMERRMQRFEERIPDEARERVLPPEPRLVVDEKMALEEYLANARAILDNYALLDEEAGVVRIPIDQAIEHVAVRGLPRWEDPDVPEPPEAEIDAEPDAMVVPDTPEPDAPEPDESELVE